MYLIAAVSDNNVIGVGHRLPWNIPRDLTWFKMHTMNSVIIMGRKTWASLPKKPLPGRIHIIMSREYHHYEKNVFWCTSMAESIRVAKLYNTKVFVIGGADIFHQALLSNHVTHAILTRVHTVVEHPDAVSMVMPRMKSIWSSKQFEHQNYSYHFEFAKVIQRKALKCPDAIRMDDL